MVRYLSLLCMSFPTRVVLSLNRNILSLISLLRSHLGRRRGKTVNLERERGQTSPQTVSRPFIPLYSFMMMMTLSLVGSFYLNNKNNKGLRDANSWGRQRLWHFYPSYPEVLPSKRQLKDEESRQELGLTTTRMIKSHLRSRSYFVLFFDPFWPLFWGSLVLTSGKKGNWIPVWIFIFLMLSLEYYSLETHFLTKGLESKNCWNNIKKTKTGKEKLSWVKWGHISLHLFLFVLQLFTRLWVPFLTSIHHKKHKTVNNLLQSSLQH